VPHFVCNLFLFPYTHLQLASSDSFTYRGSRIHPFIQAGSILAHTTHALVHAHFVNTLHDGVMDHMFQASSSADIDQSILKSVLTNGLHPEEGPEPSLEDLERELPVVDDGQIPFGDLLSRVVQSIYAELSELAET